MNALLPQTQEAEQSPLGLLLYAKNAGLARQAERAIERLSVAGWERRSVRGEDVPLLANELARRGRRVVGVTGDDLLEEWLAAGNVLDGRLARSTQPWDDPRAVYGAPALCLVGTPGASLQGRKRIAICNRYRNLAERYVQRLEARGCEIERVYISGALENVQLIGLADFIIDVVVTGETARRSGLVVREMIARSDLAVIATLP